MSIGPMLESELRNDPLERLRVAKLRATELERECILLRERAAIAEARAARAEALLAQMGELAK